ncbi:activator of Hsp90 ATPase [Pterulicium gracile]|uniref:Activator of Hsp90 ATPase n=1 Tax=Pterulicium gracile TaxID=1884261 RepID=A0A5C3QZ80_9AGAR|nr:activator of Hsp90 ATPase [Pterula gracilis]
MALPSSTANWHWKNKNVTGWGRDWFMRELVKVSVSGDSEQQKAGISNVTLVEGDVELGQRKSKLITIYDCRVEAEWTGTTSTGTEVKGQLVIPEVSHEMSDGISDYEFHWSMNTPSSAESDSVYALVRKHLPTILTTKLAEFPVALREVHGRDVTVSVDPSRSGTPAPAAATAQVLKQAATPSPASAAAPKVQKPVNTTTVTAESSFAAAADDLFGLLTDEKRIPHWSRAPAKSAAQPGTPYELFGGGVHGEYVSLTPGKEVVQTWALKSPTWPAGHQATLTTTFEQSTDSTKVKWSLANVPKGVEDELKRNIEGYYIHGLKSIGLGTEL